MTQGPPVAGVQVFFHSIDVDDPTTDDKDLDDENQEKDSHGRPPEGILRQDSDMTDGNGRAEVEFEVTMQPGDNFRVVASCVSRTEIAGNRVKAKQDDGDARVVDANGNVIKDDTATAAARKASPVLTVWRVLHVEADTMDSPPTSDTDPERNFIKGEIVRIEKGGSELFVVAEATNPPLLLHDGSPHLGATGVTQFSSKNS